MGRHVAAGDDVAARPLRHPGGLAGIAQQINGARGELRRGIAQSAEFPICRTETFGSQPCRNDGNARRESLQQLHPDAGAGQDGTDKDGIAGQSFAYIFHEPTNSTLVP